MSDLDELFPWDFEGLVTTQPVPPVLQNEEPPMSESDEDFPNAEQLFEQAIAATDPVPLLVKLIKKYPRYHPEGKKYTEGAQDNFSRGRMLASVLDKVHDYRNAPKCKAAALSLLLNNALEEAEEVFNNHIEQLCRQAFAATDPVPLLLQIFKDYPHYLPYGDLAVYYTKAVEENPYRGQALASALARLCDSPDAPTFGNETLWSLINSELADLHFKVYREDDITKYRPENSYLLDSLLSGLSLKHGLTSTSDQLASIDDGLDAPHDSAESEVLVVGACIQLLLKGSLLVTEFCGTYYRKTAEAVALKLKAHESAGTVKHPHAIQVLKLTISHAETGMKPENDRDDVWALLFPPKS